MPGKHQVLFQRPIMADILQRLLDAEAARISAAAIVEIRFMMRPVGKAAGRKAAHAIHLIFHDFAGFVRCDKDQRIIGRAHGFGEAFGFPMRNARQIMRCHKHGALARTHAIFRHMIAHGFRHIGNLAFIAVFQFAQEFIAHGRRIKPSR